MNGAVVGAFGLVAVATGHEHWLKEHPEVVPITDPLNAYIDSLPAKTLKKLEKNLAPCLLVVGCATVVVPDVVLEMKIRAANKSASQSVSGPRGSAPGIPVAPANGYAASTNGAGSYAGSAGVWAGSIPPAHPILGHDDVGR